MSTGVLVAAKDLRACLEDLRPLFGKGTNLIPVLFKIKDDVLTVCCTSGCIYKNKLKVVNENNTSAEITALYRNILDFLPKSGDIKIDIASFGLILTGDGTSIQLPVGYSLITEPESRDLPFVPIDAKTFPIGIHSLINIGLAGIYKIEKPLNIYGDITTLKYPNVIAQARTPGLKIGVNITQDFAKLFARFNPDSIYSNEVDSIVLKRGNATLEIPAEPLIESNDFLQYMEGLSKPLRLDIEHYVDRLRNMNNLGNAIRAKIVLFDDGLRVQAGHDNMHISYDLGGCTGTISKVFYLPMVLYMSIIKALGNTTIEVLYGKETICFRSPSLIIIARAII